jgi:hypothetical protein
LTFNSIIRVGIGFCDPLGLKQSCEGGDFGFQLLNAVSVMTSALIVLPESPTMTVSNIYCTYFCL